MCDRSSLTNSNETRARKRAEVKAAADELIQKTYLAILDQIFAGEKTVTRDEAERRLFTKQLGG
jgi:hypothetical protein